MLRELGDLLLRLAFFAIAPFMLVFVALLFPVTGAVLQIGLALAVFVGAEATRRLTKRWPFLDPLLSSQLEFEAFYREHPPRPFLYYVFYPLLAPYWLLQRDARREFLLYKGYTLLSFVLLLAWLLLQYERLFPPELGFSDFAPLAAGAFGIETAVVLMFLMPIVTSVVHFHRLHAPRRLALLLVAALISIGAAALRLEQRRDPLVSYATRVRVRLRSEARPEAALAARRAGAQAAWRRWSIALADVDRDGKVTGPALDAAERQLASFYREDEAHAFDLWSSGLDEHGVLVLYFGAHRGREPIWLAVDHTGTTSADPKALPEGAFQAMRHASR